MSILFYIYSKNYCKIILLISSFSRKYKFFN